MTSIHFHTLPSQYEASSKQPEEYYLAAEKLISGNPKQILWQEYSDPSGQFFTGVWQSGPGKWHVNYTEEEYCHLLHGVSIITDSEGKAHTLRPGDQFVIPRGFVGTWEVVEATTKTYVIFEPKAWTGSIS